MGNVMKKQNTQRISKTVTLYCNTTGVPAELEQTGIIPETAKLYPYKTSFPHSGSKSTLFLWPGMAVYMHLYGLAVRASPFD
jgi:hypothetical protein